MLKESIYRTTKALESIDNYGGNAFKRYGYWYLYFDQNNKVYLFSTEGYDPEFDDKEQLKEIDNLIEFSHQGELVGFSDGKVKFFIDEFYFGRTNYSGTLKGSQLNLKHYRESEPEKVNDEIYLYIGTPEDYVS